MAELGSAKMQIQYLPLHKSGLCDPLSPAPPALSLVQVLETLQGMTQQQLEGMDLLVGMRGMLEHIECRAPLPTSQSMAVATYSIEVLDLRVD